MLMHWVPEVQGVVQVEDDVDEEVAKVNQSEFDKMDKLVSEEERADDEKEAPQK